jgi:hypothetical protein
VLDQCSVAVGDTDICRHKLVLRGGAELRNQPKPASAGSQRHIRVRALNPRVRGSSPWRLTRSRLLTCTHAIDKIICRSHVDVPVLERCSLAESGAA